MKIFQLCTTILVVSNIHTSLTFAPSAGMSTMKRNPTFLSMKPDENVDKIQILPYFMKEAQGVLSAGMMAALLWSSPVTMLQTNNQNNIMIENIRTSIVADAKEMASGSGSRVNKDAESLLRYGLPIKNKEVRQLQVTIENIKQDIASKRKAAALDGAKQTEKFISSKSSKMVSSCRSPSECTAILNEMTEITGPLSKNIQASQDTLNGSEQERTALDKAYEQQGKLSKKLTELEEQMVPEGYVTPVPSEYDDLPQLKGRATVEFELKKPGDAPFDIEGTNFKVANMKMIIDGYTAPVTGGNFVDLVQKGFYTNMQIQRSDGFVVQTGDPDGEADGYIGTPSKSIGAGKHGERLIPSEIYVVGDKGPFYETTIEDEGRGGQATVLPFSSYGAMGWAREEYDANSGSSQFFWLLFDSDLTPAGKNVLDGRYPCFGYVVEGADFLRDIKEGDIITSAKVTSGLDLLKLPKTE